MGNLYQIAGDSAKAIQQYESVLKQLEPGVEVITETANAFLSKHQQDYAIKTYLKGRKILNNPYLFNAELGEIYALKRDFQAMFSEYIDLLLLNESYMATVQQSVQNVMDDDPINKKSDYFKSFLLKKIQENPDKAILAELLIWHHTQRKEFDAAFIQSKALDKRQKEEGARIFNLAGIIASNQKYDLAVKCYQYVIDKGKESRYYIDAKIKLAETLNEKITKSNYTAKDLTELEAHYKSTLEDLGKNASTIKLMRGLAHLQAFYLYKTDDAIALLQECTEMQRAGLREIAESKLELGDVLVFTGEVWEATLLYSQVDKQFKHDALGQEAKYRNAKLSYYIGEFDWAEAQLNVLKTATSEFIANDALYLALLIDDNTTMDTSTAALQLFARADLLFYQNKENEALAALDSINLLYPKHSLSDDILYKRGQIASKKKETMRKRQNILKKLWINMAPIFLVTTPFSSLPNFMTIISTIPQRQWNITSNCLRSFPAV